LGRIATVLTLVASFAVLHPGTAAPTAIRFGALWDGKGRVLRNAFVVVEGERILSVGTEAPPAGTPVVDLSRYTGVPGLIDVHTHMTYGPAPGGGRAPAVNMVLGQDAARKTLEAGVTTVRDMNAAEYMDVALRDLIATGAVVGPRMFVVGYALQRLVINRLLEGFEGKLTTSKWALLTKSSTDTALRDIQQLVERGVLVRNDAGGRSTSYSLAGL